jgi:TRAP-type mannitol/chloroaromatic compound transport system permease small subunit
MLLMIINVFYDVIMRYFFNDVSIGMQELEWHLFAAMFMFGIAYTLKEDGHVRVDIFYETMSARKKSHYKYFWLCGAGAANDIADLLLQLGLHLRGL